MQKFKLLLLGVISLLGIAVLGLYQRSSSDLEIYFLNIGQGDAYLIKSPDNFYALVDTGPNGSVVEELSAVLPFNISELDLVILTHPDMDHIGGFAEVSSDLRIENLFWAKNNKPSLTYQHAKNIVVQNSIANYQLNSEHDFRLGCCTLFDIVWPTPDVDTFRETEANEISLGFILQYGSFKMFAAGDLGTQNELASVRNCDVNHCNVDVLKVDHHGSLTSSGKEFLSVIDPEVAVISVGKDNRYGHPRAEILQNLQQQGAEVFRTDQLGRIKISTDGFGTYEVSDQYLLEKKEFKL